MVPGRGSLLVISKSLLVISKFNTVFYGNLFFFLTGMETALPQVPAAAAAKKEEPSRRAAAKKKPSVFVTLISDDEDNDWVDEEFDEDDFEIEEVATALAANKKGGRCCIETKFKSKCRCSR